MKLRTGLRYFTWMLAAVCLLGVLPAQAASVGLTVSVGSANALQGSSGNFLDIILTNNSASVANIAGFNFELTIVNPNITFTGATTSTALTYVFNGDSLFGPNIQSGGSGQNIQAGDLSAGGTGKNVAAGASAGLGRVFFSVAAGAAGGPFTVTPTAFPTTNLSDSLGGNLPFASTSGTITIQTNTAVPEPASLPLLLLGLPVLALVKKRSGSTTRQ
jgi:hypothetical protein